LYGSIIVKELIDRFTDYAATIRGGDGQEDGGYLHTDGTLHGHYWVEVSTSGERLSLISRMTSFPTGNRAFYAFWRAAGQPIYGG
jgi:hypothetical protein